MELINRRAPEMGENAELLTWRRREKTAGAGSTDPPSPNLPEMDGLLVNLGIVDGLLLHSLKQ